MRTLLLLLACCVALVAATITGPQITTHPTGGTFYKGHTISVAAVGKAPLAYQWQWAGNAAGPWNNLAGENATTLTFPNPLPPGNYYRCVVTNSDGQAASNAVPVTITP
jgi:hypothetical protein